MPIARPSPTRPFCLIFLLSPLSTSFPPPVTYTQAFIDPAVTWKDNRLPLFFFKHPNFRWHLSLSRRNICPPSRFHPHSSQHFLQHILSKCTSPCRSPSPSRRLKFIGLINMNPWRTKLPVSSETPPLRPSAAASFLYIHVGIWRARRMASSITT